MTKQVSENYSAVFTKLNELKQTKTVYSISTESQNIQELRKLSNQLNTPTPVTYSFT